MRSLRSGSGFIVLAGAVAGLAILLTGHLSQQILDRAGSPFLLASMGATAVILFAAPQSPMARPWAVLGGHLISGAVGITAASLFTDTPVAAAVAAGMSLLLMSFGRCLHPPGGATALLAVLGGETVRSLGYGFLLVPALNLIVLLVTARLFQRLSRALSRPGPVQPPPREPDTVQHARQHHPPGTVSAKPERAMQLMSRPVTVRTNTPLSTLIALLAQPGVHQVCVLDSSDRLVGVITQSDLIAALTHESDPTG